MVYIKSISKVLENVDANVILHISAAKLRADKKEGGGGEGDIQATLR
jgi:hypothetical protein